ncbi:MULTISPECIES: hypothetical protein [unclassified Rubrivivax]|uniref:hypothetical protein n=1 Tax=unclassified Rubrivivax TaxID=2649762 RepID=UPI001E2BF1C5|nr:MULTISPECIES: hypothetical protein [unclassified Rubrivivax]MCC9597412.1 hypothetical protein [Rubrivivax sp. JA1055]MCC9646331.1 hypothetical protein [Rubrivivax sp. JA1029]
MLHMFERKRIWLATAALMAVSAMYFYITEAGEDGAPESVASKVRPTSVNSLSQGYLEKSASAAPGGRGASSPQTQASLSGEVRRLASSGNPKDIFGAYQLIKYCVNVLQYGEDGRAAFDTPDVSGSDSNVNHRRREAAKACGDLTSEDLSRRLDLVERAAMAGVPAAAVMMVAEGPSGRSEALVDSWDDPLVQDWRRRSVEYLHLAADNGDDLALQSLVA